MSSLSDVEGTQQDDPRNEASTGWMNTFYCTRTCNASEAPEYKLRKTPHRHWGTWVFMKCQSEPSLKWLCYDCAYSGKCVAVSVYKSECWNLCSTQKQQETSPSCHLKAPRSPDTPGALMQGISVKKRLGHWRKRCSFSFPNPRQGEKRDVLTCVDDV